MTAADEETFDDVRLRTTLRGGPRHRYRRIKFEDGRARVIIRRVVMSKIARSAWHRSK